MIISPYPEFTELIKDMTTDFQPKPLIIDGENLDSELKHKLNNLISMNYSPDVIIGRGIVTTYVSDLFKNSTIVRIEPDFIDILYALRQARNFGDKVGIMTYNPSVILENTDILSGIFNFSQINIYSVNSNFNRESLENQIKKAKSDGMNSVIGGGTAGSEVAKLHGIPSAFLKTTKICLLNALEQSKSIISSRRAEKELLGNVLSIINCMSEGILVVKSNKILISNSKLDEILSIKVTNFYGTSIKDLSESIHNFINNNNLTKEIIKFNKKDYLVEKLEGLISFADNIIIFRNIVELQDKEIGARKKLHKDKHAAKYSFDSIIGKSESIRSAVKNASIFAQTDAEILILGDTGTGKELFAQSIHNFSERKENPFIAVNCGAIPEQLLESELFGYIDGAFSGAKKGGKAGLFELAHKGTIFLDEINSLPILLQSKLLRVIQEKRLRRIGSETEILIDTRILSASNKNIYDLVRKNEFRSDLYHRLNTLILKIPTLKDRVDDFELLADYFIGIYSTKYDKIIPPFNSNDLEILKAHAWPGNIRELENVIHRYCVLYDQIKDNGLTSNFINNDDFNTSIIGYDRETISVKKDTLEIMERHIIDKFLIDYNWNRQKVAEKLGISRSTLWRKLKD